ncbi:hypothetical protein [Rhodopirellula halodulae]|uniref:hypothetical protein n=1 Tax=Rhodopirellula halodulae TaxID=2894198 RepID=UPI001E5A1DBB|nr:hypothetical protein [Rhodopirellula sp. JC737]MCC9656288.1 hypothetical protein [Rhodopirellula sp. JC737]
MNSFEQIWESSRDNAYSWGYPVVVGSGVCMLIILSVIRNDAFRRLLKLAVIFGLAILATYWSASEIHEKWRIRGDWADTHPEQMTPEGYEALTIDGANRALGPLIYGFQAFLIFGIAALILFVIRASKDKASSAAISITTPAVETEPVKERGESLHPDNPYHPPAS